MNVRVGNMQMYMHSAGVRGILHQQSHEKRFLFFSHKLIFFIIFCCFAAANPFHFGRRIRIMQFWISMLFLTDEEEWRNIAWATTAITIYSCIYLEAGNFKNRLSMWWWCSHFRDLDIRHFWMSHHLCEWICWWYDSVNKLLWLTAVPKIDDINEHCFCANFSASRFKRPMMTNALTKNRKQIKGTNIKFHSIEFKYDEATVAIRFVCTLTRREKKK